jgi:hypothetical protein
MIIEKSMAGPHSRQLAKSAGGTPLQSADCNWGFRMAVVQAG